MHGDSTMSMVWIRMPGHTWLGVAASFIGMWIVMMAAMMLPSLVPMLWRYRRVVRATSESRLAGLTALVGVGYVFVWTLVGVAVFPIGVALAAIEMAQPALMRTAPIAAGAIVVFAGVLQFTAWKTRQLRVCRETPAVGDTLAAGDTLAGDVRTAWRHGVRLGLHCTYSCAGFTAILLAVGVMDLRAMVIVS